MKHYNIPVLISQCVSASSAVTALVLCVVRSATIDEVFTLSLYSRIDDSV
jgi:hypothetical protein